MDEGRDPMARRTRKEAASCYAGFMRARMNSSSDDAKKQMTHVKSPSCNGGKCSEVSSCLENVVKEELVSESKSGRSSDCYDETELLLVDSGLVAESRNVVKRLDSDGAGNVVAPESVPVPLGSCNALSHVYDISSDSRNEVEVSNIDAKCSESEVERESPSWTMDQEDSESSDSDDSFSDEDFWPKKPSKSYRSNKSSAVNQMPISICRKNEAKMVEEDDSYNAQYFHSKLMHVGIDWKKGKGKGEEDQNKKRSRPEKVDRRVKDGRKMEMIPKLNFPERLCSSSQTKKRRYDESGGNRVINLSSDEHENCASSGDDDENDIEKTHHQEKMIVKKNEIIVLDE